MKTSRGREVMRLIVGTSEERMPILRAGEDGHFTLDTSWQDTRRSNLYRQRNGMQ